MNYVSISSLHLVGSLKITMDLDFSVDGESCSFVTIFIVIHYKKIRVFSRHLVDTFQPLLFVSTHVMATTDTAHLNLISKANVENILSALTAEFV